MLIRVENLHVNYGQKEVLKGISLNVEKGQIVSIIGPNGSGKSTLLKTLSRCIKPMKGQVYIENQNIFKMPTKLVAKKMAILPQIKNIPTDITVGNWCPMVGILT